MAPRPTPLDYATRPPPRRPLSAWDVVKAAAVALADIVALALLLIVALAGLLVMGFLYVLG